MPLQLADGYIAGGVFQTGTRKKKGPSSCQGVMGRKKEETRGGERKQKELVSWFPLIQADVLEVERLLRIREKLRCFCSVSCLELWEEVTYRAPTSEGGP